MNDNSFGIREAKATVNKSELDRIMQGHIDSGQFTKEQLAEIKKREANKIKEAKVVAEKPKAEKIKEVEVEQVKPTKPNPRSALSGSGSTPSDVLGANNLNFFNKTEEKGVETLRELYGDDFIFEEKLFQVDTDASGYGGGGFDAITVSTKDGKKSASFDMNIGGSLMAPNLYGEKSYEGGMREKLGELMMSKEDARNHSYDILTNFINENTTQEGLNSQATKKASRKKLLTEMNLERDELAAEDIAEVEEKFKSGELFTQETKKIFSFGNDFKDAGTYEDIAFEKELKRAHKQLSEDGGKPTKDEVQMLAKSFLIEEIKAKKLTSVMNYNDLVRRNDMLNVNKKEGVQEQYNLAARELDIDFRKDMALYDLKREDLESGTDMARYKEINSQFSDANFEYELQEGESYAELENGKKVPEKIIKEYQALQPGVTAKISSINELSESIQEQAAGYSDNVAAIDISRRNYNAWEEFLVETSMGAFEIGLNVKTGIPLLIMGENAATKKLIQKSHAIKKKLQETRDSYSKDVEFEDAFSSISNFSEFAAQEVSNQIPIFAALAIPYVGTSIIGVSAFGDHYVNLNMERDSPGGRQKSNRNIWWSSVGFGASELVFERLTTIPLLRAAKRGFANTPGAKQLLFRTTKEYFKKNTGKFVYGALSEPIGEGMTQITQNWIDGKPMTQGLGHAMFSGLMFGTTLSAAPFIKGAYLNKYNDHASKAEVRKRVNKMKKLSLTNQEIDSKIAELKEYGMDGREKAIKDLNKDKKSNEKIIAQLYDQNVAEMKELEIAVQGLSSDVTRIYFSLEQKQELLKLEAQEIDNNKTLTKKQRRDQLRAVQARFDAVGQKMEAFKDKKAFGDEYTAFKGLEENTERVAELEKKAKSELFNEGKKDPTAIQINDKAKFLYNVDKINADHKANSKAGLTDVVNVQTEEDAIEYIEGLTNITEKDRKDAIKNIKNGSHGANIPTTDKDADGNTVLIPMQVVETMAADDRLETRTHEVGHSVFIKAISNNPKAFEGLAVQILQHLKTSNPSAFKRVFFRNNEQTDADEIVMLFLEEVASGKVNLRKTGNAGFFATYINRGIEEVGGKPIDLKGETDAINFLIGIAKKIKAGTITTGDIADIGENAISIAAKNVVLSKGTTKVKTSNLAGDLVKASRAVNLDDPKFEGMDISERIDSYTNGAKSIAELQEGGMRSPFSTIYTGILQGGFDRVFAEGVSNEQKQIQRENLGTRLINYDPAKTPELSKWMYGGSGKKGNIGYAALVAKEKLYKEGEKRKQEVRGDAVTEDGKTLFDKMVDEGTENDQTNKNDNIRVQKARVLKNLADINIDNPGVIDGNIRAQVDALIESNPKNLTQAIQKLIKGDIRLAIQAQMGTISFKGGVIVISDQYKKFIADNYTNIVQSLDVATIKNNYNTLFELNVIGKEDKKNKKSDNKALKKDSNFRKNIYELVTNKAKFTKFFTDTTSDADPKSHNTKLRGRQEKLAILIGEAYVVDVANDVIIDNSKDMNAVIKAELDNFVNVLDRQKKEIEGNYKDQIKYSAKAKADADFILELVIKTDISNVFSSDGKLLPKYVDQLKLKKETKAADLIWSLRGKKLEGISDRLYIQKAYQALFDAGQRGTAYEKGLIDMTIQLEKRLGKDVVQAVLRAPTEVGGKPDAIIALYEYVFNIEAKMSNAQYSSVTFAIDANGDFIIKKDYTFGDKILKELGEGVQPGIQLAKDYLLTVDNPDTGKVGYVWDNISEIPTWAHDLLINTQVTFNGKTNSYFRHMHAEIPIKLDVISEIYNKKKGYPVNVMQMMGRGLFYMGGFNDTKNILNLPEFKGDGTIGLRISSTTKKSAATDADKINGAPEIKNGSIFKNGVSGAKWQVKRDVKRYAWRAIPLIPNTTLDNMSSPHSIGTVAGLQKLIDSSTHLKMIRDGKRQQVVAKAGKNGRSAVKASKGITVLDFDDTLATSKSLVISTSPDAQAKIQEEADRLSRLTYQDYTDIGGETAPNTDIIGYRTAESIVNEDTSEYERKKRRWEIDYAEKKEMREKKSEEYLQAYKDGDAETKREIEIDASAVRKLTAEQFATEGADLLAEGWTHDFSEFSKVVEGKKAPLFEKALKLQGKFGNDNMFVLTARPADSAPAIFAFLQANGLNIPLKNITGLANSTANAKALWMVEKVSEGYNDFYFADDALQNVQAVDNILEQFDVKRKVQQAKVKFSKGMSKSFNDILEVTTDIKSEKVFSDAQAKIRGAKARYKGIIPPSAQDFMGLIYNFVGKGKKGDADIAFFKKALVDPFARGIDQLNTSRQNASNDYKNLQKAYPEVKKIINKKIEGSAFTNDQAARVYLWNKAGFDVPGLSKKDLKTLIEHVEGNPELKNYADGVGLISRKDQGYSAPGDYWLAENITSDLLSDGAIGDARADLLAEWQENVDIIFSKDNLNKIESIYGANFREALEDSLYRMRTGRNRPAGGGRIMNTYMNWVNNSVGAIMFFNMRSAILQTISATNYINWSFNNPAKAALAFANQPQYWKDFTMIFNSAYLKQRRSGNQRGINEAELSAAVAGTENKAKAAIAWLLKKGFLPTQLADSFAIASGGATFYRNKVKALVKEGMTQEQAEAQAFLDFQETTEVSQQSARPDMISQQQASPLGRLILSFQNTPMQYARIMNKAARDLANGRGDTKTHLSKIAYYGVAQSILFGALQSALLASTGEDEEEEFDKKKYRILNGMIDSVLSGIGYGGKAISTTKNAIREYIKQKDKGWNADHTYTILSLLSFSPPIGSKLRKIYSSIQTEQFNKGVFTERGLTLDNPIWSGIGNVVEGVTNIPLGRLANKMLNIDNALDDSNSFWERTALLLGWSTWDLGIRDPDIEATKEYLKKNKKKEKKSKKEANQEVINKQKQKQEKKDGKKVLCAAVSKSGNRCKTKIEPGSSYCTIHVKVKQSKSGDKVQCKKTKSNGKRCGMKTSASSGYCYYHD